MSTVEGVLDTTNRALLHELQADARLTLAEVGRRVGLSPPAVAERLARLREAGAVRGFHADVDPRALGYALSAIIRVRPGVRQIARVAAAAQSSSEVVWAHRITGEDCFIIRVHVRDVDHLEEVIDRFTPFGQTTTSIVQSSAVPDRGVRVLAE